MARIIHVKNGLWDVDEALTILAQLEQRGRVQLGKRDVLDQLVLTPVLLEVGGFEALQIVEELVAAEQALIQAVPIPELNVARIAQAQLVTEAALRAFGKIVGELV